MHFRLGLLATLASALACAAFALGFSQVSHASATANPSRDTARYLEPSSMSTACQRDARRQAACGVIATFFRGVNTGKYALACSLFGERLRSETHGMPCPRFMASGTPEAMPWGILGAKLAGSGVSVLVTLGQSELDRIRMRHHRAYVDLEGGRLRILETRLVR